ncbi:MAG: RidA family protein [Deltaproteobacteria bacterium]|nr:RidA family protein [Deltaproteobacteria bacterium]
MKTIETNSAPAAIGPYSQGKITGNLVFCSGQLPVNPATGKVEGDNITIQTRQAILNMKAVLEAGGSSLEKVVKCTVYLNDIKDFSGMNAVYAEYFSTKPARAAFQVAALPLGALVEIEAVAEINE